MTFLSFAYAVACGSYVVVLMRALRIICPGASELAGEDILFEVSFEV